MSSRVLLTTLLILSFVNSCNVLNTLSAAEKLKGTGDVRKVTGTVVAKDVKESVLLIETFDAKLTLTAKTGAAKQGLQKANIGDQVSVTYTGKGANLFALSITPEARPGGCPEGRPCPEGDKKD